MKKRSGLYPAVQVDAAGVRGRVAGRWGRAAGDRPGGRAGPALSEALGAVAEADRGARPGEGGAGSGGDARARRGLPGRHRGAARRARRVRAGRVGPDGVAHDRRAGRRTHPGALRRSTPPGPPPARAVWELAGEHAPDHGSSAEQPLVIDVDATLVTAHSEKEQARPTFKRGFGHHPLWAFVDHGPDGTGEPLAVLLRPGNAGSNTAADHITVLARRAARSSPATSRGRRPGPQGAGPDRRGRRHATQLLDWLTGQRLSYSVGFGLPANTDQAAAR